MGLSAGESGGGFFVVVGLEIHCIFTDPCREQMKGGRGIQSY